MGNRIDEHSLVRLLMEVDNHVHCIEARRAVQGKPTRLSFQKYQRMLDDLLRFAGTKRALRLIEASKD